MNADQYRNVEQIVDDLCDNLAWSRAYLMTLKGLHEVAKSSPKYLDSYPQFVSCLYHGLFDCLFIKIHNFVDSSKGACGFPHFFKVLRKYYPDDNPLMTQVKIDVDRLKKQVSIEKIKNWRNKISAHLTQTYRQPGFFSSNSLYLSELEELLNLIEEMVENYSFNMLSRRNDTRNPSADIIKEISKLFWLSTESGSATHHK
ncbi:MAG: hypothetical protein HPY65_04750 [Syntrophaceae bacterium]|nr:hypothetical protein [Syntrophaceae bacterium]